jgi:Fur family ferric uptake transcriptional regulator
MPPSADLDATLAHQTKFSRLGLRSTPLRLKVLGVFRTSAVRHLCAEDVYRELLAAGDALSISTVYKALSQFEQVGVLTRSELGQGHTVFELSDPAGQQHGHLLCTATGCVTELHLPELEKALQSLALAHGLDLTHWALTAWGKPVTPGGAHAPVKMPG